MPSYPLLQAVLVEIMKIDPSDLDSESFPVSDTVDSTLSAWMIYGL